MVVSFYYFRDVMARSAYSVNSYTGGAPTATLQTGMAATDTAISIMGTTSGWNPLGTTGGFNLAVDYGTSSEEKIYVPSGTYSWASGTVTISGITRGVDNTTPVIHLSSAVVAFVSTAVDLKEANLLVSQTLGQVSTTSGQFAKSTGSGIAFSTISESNVTGLTTDLATISGAYFPKTGGTISGAVTAASGLVVNTYNVGSPAQTLQLYDVSTSGSAYFRASANGGFVVVNSAFTSGILNVTNSGIIQFPQSAITSGIPSTNGLNFNNNGYIGDDGNFHITSSNGTIWINADDGSSVQINTQVSGTAGPLIVGGAISSTNISDSGWISVGTLSNSFTAGGLAPAYRKLNGVVYLRGNVTGGTAGATAFTLPAGYIPTQTQAFAVQQYGSTGDAYLTVTSGGAVQPSATAGWLTISFPLG
jgi:hypothetical protein